MRNKQEEAKKYSDLLEKYESKAADKREEER